MKKIFILAGVLLLAACTSQEAGLPHPKEKVVDKSSVAKEYSKMRKAGKTPLECEATILSSGESNAILRCSDGMCQSENPVGTVRKFDCDENNICPIKANTRYNRVCDGLRFASGCSVWYSPVTRCK